MNIVWHGHYAKYFEIARCALMQKIGLDWAECKDMGFAMPIVGFTTKFRRPLQYGISYYVTAEILEFSLPAVEVEYSITDSSETHCYANATSRQIYLSLTDGKACYTLPDVILNKFQQFQENNYL